jgi:hypothetical protein
MTTGCLSLAKQLPKKRNFVLDRNQKVKVVLCNFVTCTYNCAANAATHKRKSKTTVNLKQSRVRICHSIKINKFSRSVAALPIYAKSGLEIFFCNDAHLIDLPR